MRSPVQYLGALFGGGPLLANDLEIIGVPKDKAASLNDTSGHSLFVKLYGKNTITLVPGSEFSVIDRNGTSAKFQLPVDVSSRYSVWVRTLGKPGGSADMTTCYTDLSGASCCLGNIVHLTRKSGRPVATNVSDDLLNVVVCTEFDAAGVCIATTTIPLFSDVTLGYYWDLDNQGLRHVQLRFYPLQ